MDDGSTGRPFLYLRPQLEPSLGARYRDVCNLSGSCPGCDVEVEVEGPWPPVHGLTVLHYHHDAGCPATDDVRPVRRSKVGRNHACLCGSGRKSKHCCGAP